MEMQSKHINRLQKLHDFVKSNVPAKAFDMDTFRGGDDNNCPINLTNMRKHKCGTTGCLLGWSPWAIKSTFYKERILTKHGNMDWGQAALMFGIEPQDDPRWNYLFDDEWSHNRTNGQQKREALKRLRKMIKAKGILTEEMKSEMDEQGVSYYAEEDDEDQFC